jgi:hypothetical protein
LKRFINHMEESLLTEKTEIEWNPPTLQQIEDIQEIKKNRTNLTECVRIKLAVPAAAVKKCIERRRLQIRLGPEADYYEKFCPPHVYLDSIARMLCVARKKGGKNDDTEEGESSDDTKKVGKSDDTKMALTEAQLLEYIDFLKANERGDKSFLPKNAQWRFWAKDNLEWFDYPQDHPHSGKRVCGLYKKSTQAKEDTPRKRKGTKAKTSTSIDTNTTITIDTNTNTPLDVEIGLETKHEAKHDEELDKHPCVMAFEETYEIIINCHLKENGKHHGRDTTFHACQRETTAITKEMVADFIDNCRGCEERVIKQKEGRSKGVKVERERKGGNLEKRKSLTPPSRVTKPRAVRANTGVKRNTPRKPAQAQARPLPQQPQYIEQDQTLEELNLPLQYDYNNGSQQPYQQPQCINQDQTMEEFNLPLQYDFNNGSQQPYQQQQYIGQGQTLEEFSQSLLQPDYSDASQQLLQPQQYIDQDQTLWGMNEFFPQSHYSNTSEEIPQSQCFNQDETMAAFNQFPLDYTQSQYLNQDQTLGDLDQFSPHSYSSSVSQPMEYSNTIQPLPYPTTGYLDPELQRVQAQQTTSDETGLICAIGGSEWQFGIGGGQQQDFQQNNFSTQYSNDQIAETERQLLEMMAT